MPRERESNHGMRLAWLSSHASGNSVTCNKSKPLGSWGYYCGLFHALANSKSLMVNQSRSLIAPSKSYDVRKQATVGFLPLECTKSGTSTLRGCLNNIDRCQTIDRRHSRHCHPDPWPIAVFLNKMFKEPYGKLHVIRNHSNAKRIVAIFSVLPPAHLPMHTREAGGVPAFSLPYAADPSIFGKHAPSDPLHPLDARAVHPHHHHAYMYDLGFTGGPGRFDR